MDTSKNNHFYSKMPSFSNFEDFTEESHYQSLPHNWFVFVADIKGSTKAIEEGLYKEVNLIGAASITLTIQALDGLEFPFVFGGDGATLCIPPSAENKVTETLARLITLAKENFALDLRVAKIPANTIYQLDKVILVSKLSITEGRCISLFRGGGLACADLLAKTKYDEFQISQSKQSVDNLEGVSCRWSPIPSKKGKVVSLLVMARDEHGLSVYQNILGIIRKTINSSIEEANPAAQNTARYHSFFQAIKNEVRFHKTRFTLSFLLRVIEIFVSVLLYRYGFNHFSKKTKDYLQTIETHSDFRKFDDTLRLIIDCSEQESINLKNALEQAYQAQSIFYGLFESDIALMTCFVESLKQGDHLHFIDGGDGGLAMAAKQLKDQMALTNP